MFQGKIPKCSNKFNDVQCSLATTAKVRICKHTDSHWKKCSTRGCESWVQSRKQTKLPMELLCQLATSGIFVSACSLVHSSSGNTSAGLQGLTLLSQEVFFFTLTMILTQLNYHDSSTLLMPYTYTSLTLHIPCAYLRDPAHLLCYSTWHYIRLDEIEPDWIGLHYMILSSPWKRVKCNACVAQPGKKSCIKHIHTMHYFTLHCISPHQITLHLQLDSITFNPDSSAYISCVNDSTIIVQCKTTNTFRYIHQNIEIIINDNTLHYARYVKGI